MTKAVPAQLRRGWGAEATTISLPGRESVRMLGSLTNWVPMPTQPYWAGKGPSPEGESRQVRTIMAHVIMCKNEGESLNN